MGDGRGPATSARAGQMRRRISTSSLLTAHIVRGRQQVLRVELRRVLPAYKLKPELPAAHGAATSGGAQMATRLGWLDDHQHHEQEHRDSLRYDQATCKQQCMPGRRQSRVEDGEQRMPSPHGRLKQQWASVLAWTSSVSDVLGTTLPHQIYPLACQISSATNLNGRQQVHIGSRAGRQRLG